MFIERLYDISEENNPPEKLYETLAIRKGSQERPYILLNMVATVDGKTLISGRGSTAGGMGSATDQLLMRRIQHNVDAAIVGAGTLRPGNVIYESRLWRIVVTGSGDLPLHNRFFTDAPQKAIIIAPMSLPENEQLRFQEHCILLKCGQNHVDVGEAVSILYRDHKIETLLLEGGATLNFSFLEANIIDELFLTVAPRLKGGSQLPTVIDGPGLPGNVSRHLELISVYKDQDELYLRYRRSK